jgi:hypothetical protein
MGMDGLLTGLNALLGIFSWIFAMHQALKSTGFDTLLSQ